jgi:plastocyanin domain-containing protein
MGTFQKVAGILVVLFALYTLQSGLALKGVNTDVLTTKKEETKKIENSNQGEQVVEMHVTSRGFEPSTLKLKKGVPVKWVIRGDQVTSCTNRIIVPSLNISKSISFGENIVRFTPDKAGTIPFSCWMGMVRGKFLVE